jgi:hypothetical protein
VSAFVINPYAFGVDLKTNLLHYWDLAATASTMSDLHGSLDLARGGTVDTNSTGAPDGGSCVEMNTTGAAVGYFSSSSVAKFAAYDTAVTINIWARSTSSSSTGNWIINHRNNTTANTVYFQILTRFSSSSTDALSFASTSSFFGVSVAQESLNVWQMLTLRKDGNAIEVFRNGSSLGTDTFSGSFGTANAPFAIGTASWVLGSVSASHRGQVFAAGIWAEALDATQISALYNGGSGLRYAALT